MLQQQASLGRGEMRGLAIRLGCFSILDDASAGTA